MITQRKEKLPPSESAAYHHSGTGISECHYIGIFFIRLIHTLSVNLKPGIHQRELPTTENYTNPHFFVVCVVDGNPSEAGERINQ